MNGVWECSGEWSHIPESLASSVPPEPPILNGELAHFTKKQSPTPATCLLQGWISMKGCFPSRWSGMSGGCLWCNTENVAVTKGPFKVLLSVVDHSTLESVWETQIHTILTPTTSQHTEETSATSGHSETCLN